MTISVSRRTLIGAATTGAAIAASGAVARPIFGAVGAGEPPLFGPAPGIALLSRNENPYGPAPSALQAIAEWASKGCYYADEGATRMRDMIAERYGVAKNMVLLGQGSTEVLTSAALAYGQKGAILAPELFWDATVHYAETKGAKVKRVALLPDMGVDLDGLAAGIGPDVSLVHLCNPNNPTGMVLDGDQLRGFVKKVGPKAAVLVDEAYNELTNKPEYSSVVDLVKAGENVIVARTFSKIYGMAGLRLGYIIASADKIAFIQAFHGGMGPNTAGLAAGIASFNDASFTRYSKERILEARALMVAAAKSAGAEVLPSEANFVFVKVPDANVVQKAMATKGIQIRGAYGKWTSWSRASTGKLDDVKRYAAALPEVLKA